MDREKKYRNLNLLTTIAVAAVVGFAAVNELYLLAVVAILVGFMLVGVIREFYRDVITEDERTIRISEKASAQALNSFLALAGMTYIALVVMQTAGLQVNNLMARFLPVAFVVLILVLIRYAFYLYYRKKM